MAIELLRAEPLFDKLLNIQIANGNAEPRVLSLAFRVIPGSRSMASSGQSERLFHFEVTDDNDPYFLYLLDVGEQDFHLLKRDQALLVEFPVFPSKFIELVELSFNTPEEGQSSYIPKLDTATGILSVVETNNFKQLTHISLQLRPGNDAAIKAYLASRLHLSLTNNRRLSQELARTSDILTVEETQRKEMASELQELRTHRDVDEQSLRSQHTQELSQMQLTMVSNMETLREKYESQLESARTSYESLSVAYKGKAEQVEKLTIDLQHEKGHLEFRERELVRLLESATGDRDRIAHDCKEISAAKRAVEEARGALERDLARATARLEALTAQVIDKDDLLAKQVTVQKAGEESRKVLEEKLEMYITNGEALQEKLRESGVEMTRGNALITRLQAEVRSQRETIKHKSEAIARLEASIIALQTKQGELERALLLERDATAMSKTHADTLQRQLNDATDRIAESAKLIASNQEVIAYLNEEVNKWQLGLRTGAEVYAVGSDVNTSTRSARHPASLSNINIVSYSPDTSRPTGAALSAHYTSAGQSGMSGHTTNNSAMSQSALGLGLGLGSAGADKDMYLRGVKNLGLGDSFIDGALGGGDSGHELGLESFEYYAAAEPVYGSSASSAASSVRGGGRQYAWQAEDFGLEADE